MATAKRSCGNQLKKKECKRVSLIGRRGEDPIFRATVERRVFWVGSLRLISEIKESG